MLMVNHCSSVTFVMKVLTVKLKLHQHIEEKHESLMNDDSFDDSDLYEGYDEEGHRIS